ncbi:MAG TPA: hypothetical protein VGW38_09265 [Chloroflexota bacterium]|nr:hypothetical protein [Chloroflexota bacterium]
MRPLSRRQLIAGLLSALVLVLMLAWQPVPAPIMEDDPRWDCRTMGNLTCGPGAPHPAGYYGD